MARSVLTSFLLAVLLGTSVSSLKVTRSDMAQYLWHGSDMRTPLLDEVVDDEMQTVARRTAGLSSSRSLPVLQTAGMFDSGSTLLESLIELNIGNQFRWSMIGKHRGPERLKKLLVEEAEWSGDSFVVVAMVRSPLAHIAGWIKAPYDFTFQIGNMDYLHDQDTILTLPRKGGNFSGFTGLWNNFTRGYAEFGNHPKISIMVVEYEKLVYDPEPVIRQVAEALGRPLLGPFQMLASPAKDHGHPKGRDLAQQEILNMTYLSRQPMSDLHVRRSFCSRLDQGVMALHTVPGTFSPRTYADDCANLGSS